MRFLRYLCWYCCARLLYDTLRRRPQHAPSAPKCPKCPHHVLGVLLGLVALFIVLPIAGLIALGFYLN